MDKQRIRDVGLDTLLALDTQCLVIQEEPRWWVKIEARLVEPTEEIPHGIRYSLTLHDHHNQRVFGMDNAHAPKRCRRKKYAGVRRDRDHRHKSLKDPGMPYEFNDAAQLVVDFWKGVDETLTAHGYGPIGED